MTTIQETTLTVAQYAVRRLAALGITHAFGVPGDYAFPFNDALESCEGLRWVGCANELNAAYAADGYARVKGASILCTTYGVGELSALNGVMGSKAENVPVFHLAGQASTRLQRAHRITHHTLGDGVFGNFASISQQAAYVSTNLTPDNVIAEMERVIAQTLMRCQPAYITVAQDVAMMPVAGIPLTARRLEEISRGYSDSNELRAAVFAVTERLAAARAPVAFVSHWVSRQRLQPVAAEFLAKARLGYVTTTMDKATLEETNPLFIGMYAGSQSVPSVKAAVDDADCVITLGGVFWSDFNTGLWTQNINEQTLIELHGDHVRIGQNSFGPVALEDMLRALTATTPVFAGVTTEARTMPPLTGNADDPVSSANFYPRLQRFLRERDIVISETGSCILPMAAMPLPTGSEFFNQTLWGSIGWATPAVLGAALADPTRRVILVTGDGAHQLTANELGTMARNNIKPIIFVLNNNEYAIEEVLNQTVGHVYDELTRWQYHLLPTALGCTNWFTAQVQTVAELDAALQRAASGESAAYIEIVLGAADLPNQLPQTVIESLYQVTPPNS